MSTAPDDLHGIFQRHRRGIALTLGLLLLTALAGVALLGLAGHFLVATALAGAVAGSFNLFGPSAGIRALTFIRILSRYAERLLGHGVTLALARDLRVWFFRRALPLAPLGLGRYRTGDLLARLMADIEAVDGHLVRALGPLLALLCLSLLAVAVGAAVLPLAGGVLLLALLLIALVVPWSQHVNARQLEPARAQARSDYRQAVLETLEGATDLWALQQLPTRMQQLHALSVTLSQRESQRRQRLARGTLAHGVIAAVALPVMACVLLTAVVDHRLGAPAAAGVFFMTVAVLELAAGVGVAWQSWQASRASMARLQGVVDQPAIVAGSAMPPVQGDLHLHAVQLRWPGAPRAVLDGLSLHVPKGRRIALRGDSGAGKSSLLALLLRLRDPDAGHIRFGDVDLSAMAPAAWHERLAWLPQEAPVFAGTLRQNLRVGDPNADDDRLWWALEQVQLHTLVRGWTHGLDAWIGESGASLSAGQARRVALARVLLRDAPLVLLDEPTEGLDQDTAEQVCAAIARACAARSVLIITHAQLPAGTVHESWRLLDGQVWPDDDAGPL